MSILSTADAVAQVQAGMKTAGFYSGRVDSVWGPESQRAWREMLAAVGNLRGALPGPVAQPQKPEPLQPSDYLNAAVRLGVPLAVVHAVKEVESGGGWFTDVRAEILDLDGPGGFIDGVDLPKILFEAHLFAQDTGGRFNSSHPNISSPVWNRALYVGGVGEYRRLHQAMQLDETAALRSASWGMFQILGRNHRVCGFATVQDFVNAMKASEAAHLDAFVAFVEGNGLAGALRRLDWAAFARGYNGPGYAANRYDEKLASAYRKWSDRLK